MKNTRRVELHRKIYDAIDLKDKKFLMIIEPDIVKHLKEYEAILRPETLTDVSL